MIDGVSGCFRAVVPYVAGSLIHRHLGHYILEQSPFPQTRPRGEPLLSESFTSGNLGHFIETRAWKLMANVTAIHASYPFYAVAVRTMARFVTKEGHKYVKDRNSWKHVKFSTYDIYSFSIKKGIF
ncbi:unnamed protein product [Orchesella dallaii]|uniref:Uncharacterized protein n=1 Tax=Orchesella dallaii TaxID=48710 RepID=A0ABP1Q937_9HEXA